MHLRACFTALALSLVFILPSPVAAQIEEGGFQSWSLITIDYGLGEQEPEPTDELSLERHFDGPGHSVEGEVTGCGCRKRLAIRSAIALRSDFLLR